MERRRERDLARVTVVGVAGLDPIRRHLDLVAAVPHDDRTEAVEIERAAEDLLDLLRRGAGRDVPVVRVDAANGIADRAADDVRLVAGSDELRDDALHVGRDAQLGEGGRGHSRSLGSDDVTYRGTRAARPATRGAPCPCRAGRRFPSRERMPGARSRAPARRSARRAGWASPAG